MNLNILTKIRSKLASKWSKPSLAPDGPPVPVQPVQSISARSKSGRKARGAILAVLSMVRIGNMFPTRRRLRQATRNAKGLSEDHDSVRTISVKVLLSTTPRLVSAVP